ncbi:MAG: MFS transporter [Clostridia bacterium]|nr:MFS transporter [Clostridia bacterium]
MGNKQTSALQKNGAGYAVKLLGILCPLVYFASYLTRKDYSIVMQAIIESEGLLKAQAGQVESLAVISYGAGQIISGFLGDRFKPQRLIMCGLSVTILCNVLLPFTPAGARVAVWFVNGFAQSMLWPPLVRIMAATMNEKQYTTTAANTNVAGLSGTIFIYLSSSLIWLRLTGTALTWQLTFLTSVGLTVLILILWIAGCGKLEKTGALHFEHVKKKSEKQPDGVQKLSGKLLLGSGFIFIALAIISQGALRDGITDWVPTFISETFSQSSDKAILKSVVLPVIGVISMKIVGVASNKWVRNEVSGAGFTFLGATALCAGLFIFYAHNEYVTLGTAAVIVGAMHAINFFLICVVPARFEKYGIVSTMSGIINSLTYVGASAGVYLFGKIADSKTLGWNAVLISWIVIAAFGTVMCLIAAKPWNKFKE